MEWPTKPQHRSYHAMIKPNDIVTLGPTPTLLIAISTLCMRSCGHWRERERKTTLKQRGSKIKWACKRGDYTTKDSNYDRRGGFSLYMIPFSQTSPSLAISNSRSCITSDWVRSRSFSFQQFLINVSLWTKNIEECRYLLIFFFYIVQHIKLSYIMIKYNFHHWKESSLFNRERI